MKIKLFGLKKKVSLILFLLVVVLGSAKAYTFNPMYFTGKPVVEYIGGSYGNYFYENFQPLNYSPTCIGTFIPNSTSHVVRYEIRVCELGKKFRVHITSADMQGVYVHSRLINNAGGLIYQNESPGTDFDFVVNNNNLMLYEVDILYPCTSSLTSGYFYIYND